MNNDMVSISKKALGDELQMMVREEIAHAKIPSRLSDSLMSPENLDHHLRLADIFSKTEMVPKAYLGKPMNILIAMEMGNQLGLPYMQALQDIAVINGKPSLYGAGFLAVIQAHKDFEWMQEEPILKDGVLFGHSVTMKRRHHEPHTVIFTLDDARKAKLLGKAGPWTDYPGRMMKWRATSWCGTDKFADALRGVKCAEEVLDYIDGESVEVTPKNSQTEALKQKLKGMRNDPPLPIENMGTENSTPIEGSFKETPVHPDSVQPIPLPADPIEKKSGPPITEDQLANIHTLIMDKNISKERTDKVLNKLGYTEFEKMTHEDANRLLTFLEKAQ